MSIYLVPNRFHEVLTVNWPIPTYTYRMNKYTLPPPQTGPQKHIFGCHGNILLSMVTGPLKLSNTYYLTVHT